MRERVRLSYRYCAQFPLGEVVVMRINASVGDGVFLTPIMGGRYSSGRTDKQEREKNDVNALRARKIPAFERVHCGSGGSDTNETTKMYGYLVLRLVSIPNVCRRTGIAGTRQCND